MSVEDLVQRVIFSKKNFLLFVETIYVTEQKKRISKFMPPQKQIYTHAGHARLDFGQQKPSGKKPNQKLLRRG